MFFKMFHSVTMFAAKVAIKMQSCTTDSIGNQTATDFVVISLHYLQIFVRSHLLPLIIAIKVKWIQTAYS